MKNKPLNLSVLPKSYAVVKLDSEHPLPPIDKSGEFFSITQTDDEVSIVVEESLAPKDHQSIEDGWRIIKVEGPLDFALTGIMANLSSILAEGKISIFAISTYNTDYILVKNDNLQSAVDLLIKAKHHVSGYISH